MNSAPGLNYFEAASVAQRYAAARPYFHPLIVEKLREFLPLYSPVGHAVDVACGAGQSALALTALAERVTALDPSAGMLAHAPVHPQISYVRASAEAMPLASASAELMTVSLAFHWFERDRFLREAHRILKPGGHLVIYWNDFHGRMREAPEFARWYDEEYFREFPTPPRDNRPFTAEDAAGNGFHFAQRERYTNEIALTREQFVQYLTTHSNVIAHVEQGTRPLQEVHAWLANSVEPFFQTEAGTFTFGGEVWVLRAPATDLIEG